MTDLLHTPTQPSAIASSLPEDFVALLPAKVAKDKRPLQYLWVYDPETDRVHIEDAHNEHPAHFPLHDEMAEHVTHPERIDGYAISIKNGWRIVNDHMKEVDGFIKEQVLAAIRGDHPTPPLPSIRYHGDPAPQSA
jgi:hypothetical protein